MVIESARLAIGGLYLREEKKGSIPFKVFEAKAGWTQMSIFKKTHLDLSQRIKTSDQRT